MVGESLGELDLEGFNGLQALFNERAPGSDIIESRGLGSLDWSKSMTSPNDLRALKVDTRNITLLH